MNRFNEGGKVVCISDNFPLKAHVGSLDRKKGEQAPTHPVIGETLIIDEMMGDEWLMFEKYNSPDEICWWYHTRFKPLDEFEITMHEQAAQAITLNGASQRKKQLKTKAGNQITPQS